MHPDTFACRTPFGLSMFWPDSGFLSTIQVMHQDSQVLKGQITGGKGHFIPQIVCYFSWTIAFLSESLQCQHIKMITSCNTRWAYAAVSSWLLVLTHPEAGI